MLFNHSAKVIHDLCGQVRFTLVVVLYQVVILIFKQLYLCAFDFDQCAGPVFVVAYKELDSIVMLRL